MKIVPSKSVEFVVSWVFFHLLVGWEKRKNQAGINFHRQSESNIPEKQIIFLFGLAIPLFCAIAIFVFGTAKSFCATNGGVIPAGTLKYIFLFADKNDDISVGIHE